MWIIEQAKITCTPQAIHSLVLTGLFSDIRAGKLVEMLRLPRQSQCAVYHQGFCMWAGGHFEQNYQSKIEFK